MSNYPSAGMYGAETILDSQGTPVPNTPVTVYNHGTTTPASLYTDQTRGTAATNPVDTDANGKLLFFANPGLYDLVVEVGGIVTPLTVQVLPYFGDLASLPQVQDASAIWGSIPSNPTWWWQSGVSVQTSSTSGFIVVNYPAAFPNAVVALNVDPGEWTTNVFVSQDAANSGLSSFKVLCTDANGGAYDSATVRVHWSALGC
jgi:hypothetical protein